MVSPITSTGARVNNVANSHIETIPDLRVDWSGPDSGPGVVVLHGWGSSAAAMVGIVRSLSPTYRVANVDLPGHGRAPTPTKALGVPEHAQLVARLIAERFQRPVAIVGHSNGGRIGMYMASDPELRSLVSALALIAPSGVPPKRGPTFYVKKYTARLLKAPFDLLPAKLREFGLDWLRHSLVWKALGSADYRRLEGVMLETFVKTVTHHLDDRLSLIKVPTLIFWGDEDRDIGRHQIDTLEAGIPDAGVVTLKGAGHYAHIDDPHTVALVTQRFLTDVLSEGGVE